MTKFKAIAKLLAQFSTEVENGWRISWNKRRPTFEPISFGGDIPTYQ